jgi:hypothetical protein
LREEVAVMAAKSAPRIVARSSPDNRRSEGITFRSTDGDWDVEIAEDDEMGWGIRVRVGREILSWGAEVGFLRSRDECAYSVIEGGAS